MIVFRQVDARYPFLWEDNRQPPGRWHAEGEGPVHYFADTPDGAWAEFLRHEEITDPADVPTIRRQIWVVDIGDGVAERVTLPERILTGGPDSYERCQAEARRLRERGARRLVAPSAALLPGSAQGFSVGGGVHRTGERAGTVIVLFGPATNVLGWIAADAGYPPVELLQRVHHYNARRRPHDDARRRPHRAEDD
jgi:hypothetical protein